MKLQLSCSVISNITCLGGFLRYCYTNCTTTKLLEKLLYNNSDKETVGKVKWAQEVRGGRIPWRA